MNQNLKTRRERLQKLPLQKRLQAMEEIRRRSSSLDFQRFLNVIDDNKDFLLGYFIFNKSRAGSDYWFSIYFKYLNK